MSIISSYSMTALHNLLEKNCRNIRIVPFSDHPQRVFAAVAFSTAIISFNKTLTPVEKIFTAKLMRRSKKNTLAKIMSNLTFVESSKVKLPGRYPKIGTSQQLDILEKMFAFNKKIADYADEDGAPFYYRTSGGRYFKIVTDYSTGSTQETTYFVQPKFTKLIAAILSTSFFWFYVQVYCDDHHVKRFELETFPLPDLENFSRAEVEHVEKIYSKYLVDIEKNSSVFKSGTKNYKLVKSKPLIDKLDDVIGKFYGLTDAEIEYIKNFELEIRMSGADGDN